MNDFIEVWRPRIALPARVKKAFTEFNYNDYPLLIGTRRYKLRDDYGVEPMTVAGLECLYCDGICDWHNDEHVDHPYSILYVVKNDTGSYVESEGAKPIKDQPVGTMIFLNIWEEHRLWHPKGMRTPVGTYLALCVDVDEKPSSRRQCEKMMRERIKHREELFA